MKKTLMSVFGVTALLGSLLLASCEPTTSTYSHASYTPSYTTTGKKIALVTDVGTIDDKSFNQGTWEGIEAYAATKSLVVDTNYKYFQPSGGENAGTADYIQAINNAVNWGAEIVICPGFLFEAAIYTVQEQHQNVAFVLIDGTPNDGTYTDFFTGPNTVSVLFKEQESGYLAGYAAVQDGLTKLGFMGGMAVPAVVNFGIGYVAGAYQAAKELNLTSFEIADDRYEYLGTFGPSADVKTKALGWYNAGTEVIFASAGGAGSSVMAAAQEVAGKKMIGVDVDQSADSATVLTSAMKGLGAATVQVLTSFYDDDFAVGGTQLVLGAEEDGVGLPTTEVFDRFTTFTQAQYDAIYAKLVDGTIVAPKDYATLKSYVEGLGYTLKIAENTITGQE